MLVKIAKYRGFGAYGRSYLIWSPVIVTNQALLLLSHQLELSKHGVRAWSQQDRLQKSEAEDYYDPQRKACGIAPVAAVYSDRYSWPAPMMPAIYIRGAITRCINPFRTSIPFWGANHLELDWFVPKSALRYKGTPVPFSGQGTQIPSNLSPIVPKTRLQS